MVKFCPTKYSTPYVMTSYLERALKLTRVLNGETANICIFAPKTKPIHHQFVYALIFSTYLINMSIELKFIVLRFTAKMLSFLNYEQLLSYVVIWGFLKNHIF